MKAFLLSLGLLFSQSAIAQAIPIVIGFLPDEAGFAYVEPETFYSTLENGVLTRTIAAYETKGNRVTAQYWISIRCNDGYFAVADIEGRFIIEHGYVQAETIGKVYNDYLCPNPLFE